MNPGMWKHEFADLLNTLKGASSSFSLIDAPSLTRPSVSVVPLPLESDCQKTQVKSETIVVDAPSLDPPSVCLQLHFTYYQPGGS